jgi:hypothetical protein
LLALSAAIQQARRKLTRPRIASRAILVETFREPSMTLTARASLAALTLYACAAEAKPPASLSWMSGYWLSCEDGRQVTETWSAERDGVLVGANFSTGGGKPAFELLTIAPMGDSIAYLAMPAGQPLTAFPLSAEKSTETKLVFENLAHDFPQRIIYERDGEALGARIEGMMNGKLEGLDWRFASAPLNEPCPA